MPPAEPTPRSREVVVTGVGVVSPIGIGREECWQAMLQGRSGVHRISNYDPTGLAQPFGGEIRNFDPKAWVKPRKSLKVMSNEIQWAFAAADMAFADAGLASGSVDPERMGVLFGTDMIYSDIQDIIPASLKCMVDGQFDFRHWGEKSMEEIYPLWLLKTLPNMPACHIGIALDARGPTNTITLGEVSALLAFTEAMRVIQRGDADVVITGGTGSRLHPAQLAYRGQCMLSRRDGDPATACRPFDAGRDGLVNGEGAAAFIVESREHAEARKATILARALGYANTFEPRVPDRPFQGTAIRSAIGAALRSAGLSPEDIGHVNANGLSTVQHDRAEAQAIRETLGDVPVTAPKSLFGNLGAGTAAVEMIASVLGLSSGQIPATLNYEHADPECPVNVICGGPERSTKQAAVVLNQATMGQSAAVVLAAE